MCFTDSAITARSKQVATVQLFAESCASLLILTPVIAVPIILAIYYL